jgi:hypothetical protein
MMRVRNRAGAAAPPIPPTSSPPRSIDAPTTRPGRRPFPEAVLMTSANHVPDPVLAVYPFADRIVPADTAFKAGATLPCSGAKVQKQPLAATLVAIALWQLREAGAVRLEPFDKKRLLGRQRRVGLARSGAGTLPGGFAHSFAGWINDGGPDANTVEAVVARWFEADSPDPSDVVIERVALSLQAAGFLAPAESVRASIVDQLKAGTGLQADCATIETLRTTAEAVITAWQAFTTSEAEVHGLTLKEVERAIKSRREVDNDSDGPSIDFD